MSTNTNEITTAVTDALLYKLVDGKLTPVYYQTLVECVKILEDGGETTLAAKLEAIISTLNTKASTTDLSTAVTEAVAALVDGAPEELDTLKELAELAKSNSDLMTALNSAISSKVDKVDGETLIPETLLAILSPIDAQRLAKWDSYQTNVLEGVQLNGEELAIDENKKVNIVTSRTTMGTSFPSDMNEGDFHILIPETTTED